MQLKPNIDETMDRIRRFNGNGRKGEALINIDLNGSGFPLMPRTPLCQWNFPQDLRRYLDECVEVLKETWSKKIELDDDSIPCLYPRFGIAEHSAFVGDTHVEFSTDTSYPHPIIRDWSDLAKLQLREENQWLRMVVDGLHYLVEKSGNTFAVMQRGSMSPMELANALRGNDLFMDFYDCPEQVHKLVEFCTAACRFYIDHQKSALPDFHGGTISGCFVWMPGNSAGHLSEDASVLCSVEHYRQFGRPYTARLAGHYEHVFMHLHTAGAHCYEEIASIDRLDYFELANDPNTARGIALWKKHQPLFQNKVVKLFVTFDEIKANLESLQSGKTILFCTVADIAEGRDAIEFVRRELAVK